MKCQAIVSGESSGFSLETITLGQPADDEVLVQIKASGVCHTDYDSMAWPGRLVMGHEGAGEVVATGNAVTTCKLGDRVLLNWAIPCYCCPRCKEGNQSICETNSPVTGRRDANGQHLGHALAQATLLNGQPINRAFNLGTMSQYTIVKSAAVVRIPDCIPYNAACILGCGVMTGYGSACNVAKVTADSSCVVLGSGGVGLNVIQGCRIAGAAKIIAIDISRERLDMAKQFGATHVLLADRDARGLLKAAGQVKAMTNGRGSDYAFECTSVPALGAAPLAMVRNAGVAVQVSGIEESITFDMALFEWDKLYINPLYGKCKPLEDFPKLFRLYESGQLLLDELISQTYRLDQLDKAFEDMIQGRIAKGVISF